MNQHRYHFKKPRGEIVKDILYWLVVGGMIAIAATSPYFLYNTLRALHRNKKYRRQSVLNAFTRLRKEGAIVVRQRNHQMYISLTSEGSRRAGRFQMNDLKIKTPKRWDGKWRIVIFDIPNKNRVKREALRGFLKRLGFYKLQQSVWIHPFDCSDEIIVLRDFFGFMPKELQFIVAERVDCEAFLRRKFHLVV